MAGTFYVDAMPAVDASRAGNVSRTLAALLASAGGAAGVAWLAPAPHWVALGAVAAGALVAWILPVCSPHPSEDTSEANRRDRGRYAVGDSVLRAVSDAGPDAVLLIMESGEIRYSNPVARDLFFEGRRPEGQNFIRLASDAPVPLREALLTQNDRLFSLEIDGRHETFHVARRTLTLDGELHTLLLVKHMTREIARREVEVLKRVVRLISHEANNSLAPVTSLVHSARMMAKSPDPAAKLERVFDTIEERASHLRAFLDGYAGIARLPQPRPVQVEWSRILRQLGELYPELRLPHPPERTAWFDPIQLEQVMINLLKNAREAGSAVSDIELRVAVTDTGESEVDLLDRGRGFSDEGLKNALVPLYSTKEHGGGMGLALCREIVEAHGGSIGVSNRQGGGAWIRLVLPGRTRPENASLGRSRLTLTRA